MRISRSASYKAGYTCPLHMCTYDHATSHNTFTSAGRCKAWFWKSEGTRPEVEQQGHRERQMSTDARSKCKRCTGTDVVNIQGCDLCRLAKVTSRCRVMEHLRHALPHASDCGATLPATQGGTLSQRNKVCLGRHTWGAMPFGAWGKSLPLCSAVQRPSLSDPDTLQYHAPDAGRFAAVCWQVY